MSISPAVEETPDFRTVLPAARRLFLPLVVVLTARSFLASSLWVYLPTFLEEKGASLLFAGGAISIYAAAGVIGALVSGTLSDRIGRKPVLVAATFISPLLLFAFLHYEGWVRIVVLIVLGFVSLSSPPVLLAVVQDHLTVYRSAANGTYLAMSFVTRSITAVIVGMLADRFGLESAFFYSGLIVLLSLPVVLALPEPRPLTNRDEKHNV